MKTLEWNPAFDPVMTGLIVLITGGCFYRLFAHLVQRHGRMNAWRLILPKMLVASLLIVALLDPGLKLPDLNATPARVLILQDVSSSMDLRDDGSSTRSERASALIRQLKSHAPASVRFELLPFDTTLHPATYTPKREENRGTALAVVLQSIGVQPSLADADGVIVLSDGGDETVELSSVPTIPTAIIGVGTSPNAWNDIGIGGVIVPAEVEEKSEFDLVADLYARAGTNQNLKMLHVTLEQIQNKTWVEVQSQMVDLASSRAAVTFHLHANGTGPQRYRLRLQELPGELTYANNTRTVSVQVQKRTLHVLFFTQELGINYKYLRAGLGADPGIAFTAMYRVLENQFTVQGDRTGFEDLAQGFPTRSEVLQRYDCVILGSFAASQFSDAQAQTLANYVENGGALVLLGGESSFGRGGYARSKIAPLIPWMIGDEEPGMAMGSFPVSLSASSGAVDFLSGIREDLNAAGGAFLESLNEPGGLRPGAVALFDATNAGRTAPVIAWQRFGKGQVLGIATNTMWKWAAAGHGTLSLYGRFWRQAVRGLTKKLEGGSLIGVHWNQEHYRPGGQAVADVQVRGPSDSATRLVGTLSGPGSTNESQVNLSPVMGQTNQFTAKLPLAERGDYTFRLQAYTGSNLAETYERVLTVDPQLEESASPELKEAYLKAIAARSNGIYANEKNIEAVQEFIRDRIVSQAVVLAVPLVDFRGFFPALIIAILVIEWIVRRKMNLV